LPAVCALSSIGGIPAGREPFGRNTSPAVVSVGCILAHTGFVKVVMLIAVLASMAAAQGLSPDEVRVSSKPYVVRPAFHVETKLVEVGVVVRDSQGRAVSGLTRENFKIHDNGKEREIADFTVDSTVGAAQASPADSSKAVSAVKPRFIALFFDDVNTKDEQHSNDLKQTTDAAQKFVNEALRPGVQIGVFTASGAQTLDFTNDATKIGEAIGSIRAHPQLSEQACVTPYLAYQIEVAHSDAAIGEALYQSRGSACQPKIRNGDDARAEAHQVWLRAKEVSTATLDAIGRVADRLAPMPGARVLLLASSGFLAETLDQERDRVVARALNAGVVINSLDSKGVYGEPTTFGAHPTDGGDVALTGNPRGVKAGLNTMTFNAVNRGLRVETLNDGIAALAEETGGTFFHNSNDLHAGFIELGNPPEVTYRLTFHPENADGSFHKLKITLTGAHGDSVQARKGYFAAGEKNESRADNEVLAQDEIADFPVDISGETAKAANGETVLSVLSKIDISKLSFAKQGGRRKQNVRFVSALLDAQGAVVAAKEATMELSLKDATYERLLKTGLNAKLSLQARSGSYRLREVVEDSEHHVNCTTHPVELP
jgi:VWFA-related protein